jgi:hypothetical protein
MADTGRDRVSAAETAMRKVFLSHSFGDPDRSLVSLVERLIRAHGLVPTFGRNLGGGALSDEVTRLVDEADAVVALLTRRPGDAANVTHPWVLQEHGYARMKKKRAIALYEAGVPVQGVDGGFEHIDLDRADAAPALVRLSEVLGDWRARAGRLLKVQVLPEDVARQIGRDVESVRLEYRCQVDDEEGRWEAASVRREALGVFAYMRVPDATTMLQLRAIGPGVNAVSPYTPLWMPIRFE